MIFTCTWCYATWSSLALDATLHDLHLHLVLRYMIFTCTWCYATWSSLTFWWRWGGVGKKGPLPEWHDKKQNAFLKLGKQKLSFRFNEIRFSCGGNVRKRHDVLSAAHLVVMYIYCGRTAWAAWLHFNTRRKSDFLRQSAVEIIKLPASFQLALVYNLACITWNSPRNCSTPTNTIDFQVCSGQFSC